MIDRLEDDHEYLTEGGVFTPDLIETWISYKRNYELAPYNLHPTPYEFALYYDAGCSRGRGDPAARLFGSTVAVTTVVMAVFPCDELSPRTH